MEFWEFLIQKDGDRSWLPLESPDVEVLEGRYRVVVRTSRLNTAVEIRISHLATAENPPKRRIQKRSGQTNHDGLIVVIPFTRLQPGLWELRCTGDLMADLLGESWQHTVKLQVLSHATAAEGDWEPDWQVEDDESSDEFLSGDRATSAQTEASAQTDTRATTPAPSAHILQEGQAEVQPTPAEPFQPEEFMAADMAAEMPTAAAGELLTSEPIQQILEQAESAESAEFIEASPAPGVDRNPAIATSAVFQMAAQMSEDLVNSIFQELDEITSEPVPQSAAESVSSASIPQPDLSLGSAEEPTPTGDGLSNLIDSLPKYPASGLPVQVKLDRDTYMARRGGVLVVSGQVELLPLAPTEALTDLPAAQLQVYLRDPQTAHTLVKTIQPLPTTSLPLVFDCHVPIPADYQTRLLLGELMVVSVPQSDEMPLLLANQPFQVTADLNELLEAIANAFPDSDAIQPPLEFTNPAAANLDLTFLEFLQSPKPVLQFQASEQEALPPQLHPTQTSRPKTVIHFSSSSHAFSISNLPEQHSSTAPADESTSASTSESTADALLPNLDSNLPANPALSLADILADEVLDNQAVSADVWDQGTAVNPSPPQAAKIAPAATSPEDTAFRSLNLKGRFLSRLNALATDAELSSSLQQAPLEPLPVGDAPMGLDTDLAAQEVVVDDEPPPPLLPWTASAYQPPQPAVEPPKPPMLADDEPVPVPEFEIPPGELTSGQSIFVAVRLPQLKPRIYVKLWIRDRQTRSLLDGPRWLVAFVPDGSGYLETRTQLMVPYGCLEAQFEAIAVEMATQRESNKVTMTRNIMPPDLPALLVDDE